MALLLGHGRMISAPASDIDSRVSQVTKTTVGSKPNSSQSFEMGFFSCGCRLRTATFYSGVWFSISN